MQDSKFNQTDQKPRLKIGFIGFGKYGYGVLKGITKSGHHDINNIYYLKIEDYLGNNASDSTIYQEHVTNLNDFKKSLISGEKERTQYFDEHYLVFVRK